MNKNIATLISLFFIACMVNTAQAASSILVWPVFQAIEADQTGSALWLENRGAEAVMLQVRIMGWQQPNQQDSYQDQQKIVASPPFTTIEPGQRQLIRLMRLTPVEGFREDAYRIIIDEIPLATNTQTHIGSGLKLQMRYLLPLFVTSPGIWTHDRHDIKREAKTASRPVLTWTIEQNNGQSFLVVQNTGIVHARLSNVFLGENNQRDASKTVITDGFLGYVLAASTMRWPIPSAVKFGNKLQLYAQLADNTEPIEIPHGQ
jgi:fimbrial chaperone protein